MCGIAAFSLASGHSIDRTMLVRLLLAGLAERGEDACGYASHDPDGSIEIVKHAMPPHEFLAAVRDEVDPLADSALVHVRDFTKGRPAIEGNNHPIRHGAVVGVHNGIIQNDDALFERFGRTRQLPDMSVDSEAIFMLLDALDDVEAPFGHLIGSYSTAWFDERRPGMLYVAKGRRRPLVVGTAPGIVVVASTRHALEFAASRVGVKLQVRIVPDRRLLELANGEIVDERRIYVHAFEEAPATRYSPHITRARETRRQLDDDLGVHGAAS